MSISQSREKIRLHGIFPGGFLFLFLLFISGGCVSDADREHSREQNGLEASVSSAQRTQEDDILLKYRLRWSKKNARWRLKGNEPLDLTFKDGSKFTCLLLLDESFRNGESEEAHFTIKISDATSNEISEVTLGIMLKIQHISIVNDPGHAPKAAPERVYTAERWPSTKRKITRVSGETERGVEHE